MTTWPYRRQWWGFTDIGPVQIPPNPQYLILTDRTTKALWWVFWNASTQQVGINSVLPANTTIDGPTTSALTPRVVMYNNPAIYSAFDEPVIGFFDSQNFARLIVDQSALGFSVEQRNKQLGTAPQSAPLNIISSILGFNGTYATIILSGTVSNPAVGYTVNTIVQTPNPPPYVPQNDFPSQQIDD